MAIEPFSVDLEVLDKEIGYYKTAINELKTNPNACKVPPAICSETEFSPIMEEFFMCTVWYSEFDLPEFDGDIDTVIVRFGKVLNKNDIKHYTLGESWSILGELYHAERFNGGLIYNAFKNGTLLELLERMLELLLNMQNKYNGK